MTRGGKRKGAGRKPEEPTTTIRIPLACKEAVLKLVERYKHKVSRETNKEQ